MDILNPYYSQYQSIALVEELFLALARDLLVMQGPDSGKNTSKIDYIDITSSDDNKTSTIEIRLVPCRLTVAGLEMINLFTGDTIASDTSGTFTIPYPFGQPSLLSAVCKLGIWIADMELAPGKNPQSKKIITYSFTSNRNINDYPMFLSISARDFPLEFADAAGGAWLATKAKSWLSGSI